MAKRKRGLGRNSNPSKARSHKTKKRLETKRLRLEALKNKRNK